MSLLTVGPTGTYPTVQAGVNAAVHGDTVGIQNGTYPEAIGWNNKFIALVGLGTAVLLTGAGAGAAPTILLTGTGGGHLENLTCSNVGSTNQYVLDLNVYQHWCRRVRVNGTGGKKCFHAQYLENCVAYNGLNGFVSSCLGENILRHVSVVNMTGQGIVCSAANGTVQACLVYNTVGGSVVNYNADVCAWNFVSDNIQVGIASKLNQALADFAFTNLAGGDVSLLETSRAFFEGVTPVSIDFNGRRRRKFNTRTPRIYAGAYSAWPPAPQFATGNASVRSI